MSKDLFAKLVIECSGDEIREAATAKLNRLEHTGHSTEDSPAIMRRLRVMSKRMTKGHRFELTLDEASYIGLE